MLNCPRCNRRVKLTSAIKSRVRRADYEYQCPCGEDFYITPDDIETASKKRFMFLGGRKK